MGFIANDTNVSAFIIAKGIEPVGIRESETSPGFFCFEFPDEAREVSAEYWRGGLVSGREYAKALRRSRRRLMREQDSVKFGAR